MRPPLALEVMVGERTMKRVRRIKWKSKATQLQVPDPDQRMMGEVWWMGAGSIGRREG